MWEIKARLACLNGGAIPLDYFRPENVWSHPSYPLLVPLTENWLYSWLDRCDQGALKIIFVLFYVAAIGLLYTAAARSSGHNWKGFLAAALLFFTPLAIMGEGSVSTGYADFPLAVFYLACVMYALEYVDTGEPAALALVAALGAGLVWVKPEGLILWISLVAALAVARRRHLKAIIAACLPSMVVFLTWNGFLRLVGAPQRADMLPLTLSTLLSNWPRAVETVQWMGAELLDWRAWGLLWPAFIAALLFPASDALRRRRPVLLPLVAIPLLVYMASFPFSTVPLEFSLPRLMLHTALIAVLAIALALPERIASSSPRVDGRHTVPLQAETAATSAARPTSSRA